MPTKKSKDQKLDPKIGIMDVTAKKLLSVIDSGYNERQLISEKDARIQAVLTGELELMKGISQGNIIDFVMGAAKDSARSNGRDPNEVDGFTMFTEDVGNLFGYFQELYKNRYVELTDLKFITKFIPAIGEAVRTTLDSIVSADDFSTSITRNLEFGPGITDDEKAEATAEIKRIEQSEDLLRKLRNIVYNKTLISGNHYVYCIPYAELFNEYDRLVKEQKIVGNHLVNNAIARGIQSKAYHNKGFIVRKDRSGFTNRSTTNATEASIHADTEAAASYDSQEVTESGFSPAMEAIINDAMTNFTGWNATDIKSVKTSMQEAFNSCYIVDTHVPIEALENFSSLSMMKEWLGNYSDTWGGMGVLEEKSTKTVDGTMDINMGLPRERFTTKGSYIKYIDANRLVPIMIYGQIIGGLYVHDMSATKKAAAINTGMTQTNLIAASSNVFSSTTLTEDKRNRAVQTIVDAITDGILANFSNKFVNKNADFKKLIADCITANGLVNNQFQIQFIPAKYLYTFTVNETENGIGQSILLDSLFPAKMLLSLLVSKLLLFMNKSGNKTIAYVRKGPIDLSTANHIQRTTRMLQESNITFSDLLSTNLSFAKFSRNGNIQLPMARNGDRLIDFETQEGQEVDLHTPMEEYLEKLAIMGTGVPSVIMEYTDAADYAKSIVTANIKFAARVATLQAELEESTTKLYKALIMTSNMRDDLKTKLQTSFEFKLARPRVLTNANMSDYLSQVDSITQTIARLMLGENPNNEDDEKLRTLYNRQLAIKMLPFVDWDEYEEILKKCRIQISGEKDLNNKGGVDSSDPNAGLNDLGAPDDLGF